LQLTGTEKAPEYAALQQKPPLLTPTGDIAQSCTGITVTSRCDCTCPGWDLMMVKFRLFAMNCRVKGTYASLNCCSSKKEKKGRPPLLFGANQLITLTFNQDTMSIAEFYLDHGIDPSDPNHMDKFFSQQFGDGESDCEYDVEDDDVEDDDNGDHCRVAVKVINEKQLKEYNVCGLPVSPCGLSLIAELLQTNTSLQKLELESEECYQIGEAYQALGDALRVNTTLTELHIVHHPQATPAQELALINGIAVNQGLKVVRVDDMSQAGKCALAEVMQNR
jgi:hypothetical protein